MTTTTSIPDIFMDQLLDNELKIPRDFQIECPCLPLIPAAPKKVSKYNNSDFNAYKHLVAELIPSHKIDPANVFSPCLSFIKQYAESPENPKPSLEIMIHQYLIATQNMMFTLVSSPSLTKSSLIHNELVVIRQIISQNTFQKRLSDFCDMLIADAADIYHSYFTEVIEDNFWAKSRPADEIIDGLLKREMSRLKMLGDYSYKQLSGIICRKIIDGCPQSNQKAMMKWIQQNGLNVV